jgi:hypothetical protein
MGWTIPKLPPQSTKHQFSLKALLIFALIAGPILALAANLEPALISSYRFAIELFAVFPRSDSGFILKFMIVGVIAFVIVPFYIAKLHPLIAWIACVVCAGAVVVLWHYATDNIISHHPVLDAARSLSIHDPRRVLEDPQIRVMLDVELATAATFVLLGTIIGGSISLISRKAA